LAILRQLSFGQPRTALLDAASDDRLLVGSRGGGLEGMLLGSVSQAIVHHAPCLVDVVRRNYGNPVWEDR
jgi:nucleotide-binding universal stress UspA family protein